MCPERNSANDATDLNAGADLNAGSADMNATGNSNLNTAGADTETTDATGNSAATNGM